MRRKAAVFTFLIAAVVLLVYCAAVRLRGTIYGYFAIEEFYCDGARYSFEIIYQNRPMKVFCDKAVYSLVQSMGDEERIYFMELSVPVFSCDIGYLEDMRFDEALTENVYGSD